MEKTQVRRGWRFSSATVASIMFLVVYAANFAVHGDSDHDDVDDREPILMSPPATPLTETT